MNCYDPAHPGYLPGTKVTINAKPGPTGPTYLHEWKGDYEGKATCADCGAGLKANAIDRLDLVTKTTRCSTS